jgi:hypothetical protein
LYPLTTAPLSKRHSSCSPDGRPLATSESAPTSGGEGSVEEPAQSVPSNTRVQSCAGLLILPLQAIQGIGLSRSTLACKSLVSKCFSGMSICLDPFRNCPVGGPGCRFVRVARYGRAPPGQPTKQGGRPAEPRSHLVRLRAGLFWECRGSRGGSGLSAVPLAKGLAESQAPREALELPLPPPPWTPNAKLREACQFAVFGLFVFGIARPWDL